MKRWIALLGLSWCLCVSAGMVQAAPEVVAPGTAVALAPEPAVGNNPSGAVTVVKAVVNYLEPQYETLLSLRGHGFRQGVSGALWKFSSNSVYLGSARLGWAVDDTVYGALQVDAAGLVQRFAPSVIKQYATAGPFAQAWAFAGEHGKVSSYMGYSWDYDKFDYGMTLGVGWKF